MTARAFRNLLVPGLVLLCIGGGALASAQAVSEAIPDEETSLQRATHDESGEDDAAPPAPEASTPAAIAAEAYARGDWETAIAQYRSLLAEGYEDPALLYNLGTAYARADQKGRAVWMFLRALQLSPRDASIRKNLNLVAPDVGTQMALFPFPPMEGLYRSLRLNEWAAMGGAGTLLAALAFGGFLAMRPVDPRRRWLRRIAVIMALMALTGHGFATARYYEETLTARGVITDPNTQPRSAPSEASEVYTFTMPPGTLIRVQQAGAAGWIKAIYGGSNEVFIREDQYERL